jgi:hypothetical protein
VTLVEVRNLADGEAAPSGAAWVLIEKVGETFAVNGQANGNSIAASFSPRGFDTGEAAIKASVAWADLLGIPLIYVKGLP